MNKEAKFWDKISAKYYKKPIDDQAAYEHKLNKTREYLSPEMNALEIGCGTGGTALLHAPYVKNYTATDISPKMIEIAKERPDFKNISNVSFQVESVDSLEVGEGKMDAVFALSILHLLRDPGEALDKIYKFLKPGGIFVSSTTCISDIMPAFRYFGPVFYKLGIFPFVNVFSENDLIEFTEKAGFQIDYTWKRQSKKEGKDSAVFVIAKKPL